MAVARLESWGAGTTPSRVGPAITSAGKAAGGTTGRIAALGSGITGAELGTGTMSEAVAGITELATAVRATATTVGRMLASAGAAAGATGV